MYIHSKDIRANSDNISLNYSHSVYKKAIKHLLLHIDYLTTLFTALTMLITSTYLRIHTLTELKGCLNHASTARTLDTNLGDARR